MKYILEIKPEYEANGIMILGARDSHLYVTTLEVKDLEELNSDYINEHYGGLQDEAYHRGLAEGKKAFDLLDAERDAEYQRGLEDAWEAARKIVKMPDPPYWGVFGEYKDDLFRKITAAEAIEKLKAYDEKQKAEDEIKVGDEVERSVYGRTEGKGIYLEDADEEGDWLKCLFWTGATFTVLAYPKEQFKKTGRHFDIASILEAMQK